MTDSNKKGPDDWDSAIDEWDKAFTPEVATDKETKKIATLSVIPMMPGEVARSAPSPTITEAPSPDGPKPPLAPPPPGTPAVPAAAAAPIPILNVPHVASRVPRPVSFVPRPLNKPEAKSAAPKPPPPPSSVGPDGLKGAPKPSAPTPPAASAARTEDDELPESELDSDVDLEPAPSSAAAVTPRPAGLPDDVDALLGVSDDEKTVVHDRNELEAGAASPSTAGADGAPMDVDASDVELLEGRDSGVPPAPATEPLEASSAARCAEPKADDARASSPVASRPSSRPPEPRAPEARAASSRPPPAAPTRPPIPRAPPTTPGFRTDEALAAASGDLPDDRGSSPGKPVEMYDAEDEKTTLEPPPHAPPPPVFAPRGDFADIPTQDFIAPEIVRAAGGRARGFIADDAREAFAERAAWLEAEARASDDPGKTARGLLAVSEIKALLGDDAGALEAAVGAAEASPELVLAHKQARGLTPTDDVAPLVAALDHEVATLEVPAGRTHAALFAADLLRLRGDEAAAAERWEQAARAGDFDVRVALARAVHALAAGQLDRASAVKTGSGSAAIAKGLGDLLRVRGHEDGADGTDIEGPLAVNDALRRTRSALDAGDIGAAVGSLVEVGKLPELAPAARWVAASLAQTRAATRASAGRLWSELAQTDPLAVRSLAGCAVELGDPALLEGALGNPAFSIADRATLATLLDVGVAAGSRSIVEETLATLAGSDALAPLASAIAGTCRASLPGEDDPERGAQVEMRAGRVAGNPASRDALRLGRLVATAASPKVVEAVATASPGAVEARAVALEIASRAKRFGDVSDAIKGWTSPSNPQSASDGGKDGAAQALLAAALVAERGHDLPRALSAYREARTADPTNETLLRIVAALDPAVEPPGELNQLADDLGEGLQGALARLEAVVREREVDDRTRSDLLERAHRAAPDLVLPQLMAEQLARKNGDVEEVLRWIRERRATSTDALEQALDSVREALLVADTQPQIAADRLEEALKTRPSDAALRELYERLAPEPPADRAAWREQRAAVSTGDARALYFMEAAHEYERMGDHAQALKAAIAAVEAGDSVLARIARERAEVEASEPARLADELLTLARSTDHPRERREAYERLADLDATARADASSAILWHRSILEEVHDYKPSLRHVEQALLSEGRDDELEPIATSVAKALSGSGGGEAVAHAAFAARLRARGASGDVDSTFELAELAASQPDPPLAALRLLYAHARSRKDDALLLKTTMALVERATRPLETSALLVRAAEAALRLDDLPRADELLTRAKAEDAADMVMWRLIADVKAKTGKKAEAAEAYESLARTSAVPSHQLAAWYDAAVVWQGAQGQGEQGDEDRAVQALEQASTLDVTYKDVFSRLLALYTKRGAGGELATLLERRVATITDPAERVAMEVERGRALLGVHDLGGAREALQAALAADPDHTAALAAFGDLCAKQGDWEPAEQAWVRLARLLTSSDEQRDIYARLGELYSSHAVNLTRAETAWKEVLKRAPDDVPTLDRLIDVHRRQNDAARAGEIVQQLAVQSKDPAERRRRLIELSQIHENPGKDLRKAEQVLEGARREAPTDVTVLRALAEFYLRHKQMPAVQILLDRAAADARRAFAAGRFAPALFEVMRAVFDLRGKKDAANVVAATLAALEGSPAQIRGGELRALDPRLDDLLAPELISPSLRALLSQCGDALDAATPFDARAAQAAPMQGGPVLQIVDQFAQSTGLPQVQVLVSPKLPRTCVALGSSPPVLVVGDALAQTTNDRARAFLIVRAIKLVLVHSSALVRAPATDVVVLVSAWLQAFNPTWVPDGVNTAALAAAAKRVAAGMPRDVPADAGVMALEIAGALGAQMATLGASTLAWANRAALLAVGDPNAALDAVAWTMGKDGAPTDPKERGSWVVRTREASDLLAFSVSDAYAEARARLGLDK